MEKQVQAVLFDMDGVIFDSERLVIECWQAVAEKHNIPDIVEICMRVQGINRVETGKKFLEKYGNDFPYETYKKEVTALFRQLYGEGRLPVKPGVREILAALKQEGIPMAVASSTRSDIVRMELEEAGILQHFDAVLGGDMVAQQAGTGYFSGCGQSSWRRTGPLLCAGRFLQWDPGGVPGGYASHYGAGHAGPYGRNA